MIFSTDLSTLVPEPASSSGSRRNLWLKAIGAIFLNCASSTLLLLLSAASALAVLTSVSSPRKPSLPKSMQIFAQHSRILLSTETELRFFLAFWILFLSFLLPPMLRDEMFLVLIAVSPYCKDRKVLQGGLPLRA